jgi:hypothetical protein
LISPGNNELLDAGIIDFKFKVQKPTQVNQCELLIDNKVVESPVNVGNNRIKTISHDLKNGTYVWKIQCNGATITSSSSRNIHIGSIGEVTNNEDNSTNGTEASQENPDILLISPEDAFITTGAQNILFSFDIKNSINASNLRQCNLIFNNIQDTNITNISQTNNKINIAVSEGSHTWAINCSYTNNQTIDSQTRSLTINSPAPASSGGGGSGGGGGGGGSSFSSKTNTPTNQTNSSETTNNITENKNKTTESNPAGITGAVTGDTLTNNNIIPTILIVLVMLGGISFIYFKKKK